MTPLFFSFNLTWWEIKSPPHPPTPPPSRLHCSYSVAIVAPLSQQELLFGPVLPFVLEYETNINESIPRLRNAPLTTSPPRPCLTSKAVCLNPKKFHIFPNHWELPHIDLWLPFLATSPFFFSIEKHNDLMPSESPSAFSMSWWLCCFLNSKNRISKFPFLFSPAAWHTTGLQPSLSFFLLFCPHVAAAPQPQRFAPHPPTNPGRGLTTWDLGRRASDSGSCREPQGRRWLHNSAVEILSAQVCAQRAS